MKKIRQLESKLSLLFPEEHIQLRIEVFIEGKPTAIVVSTAPDIPLSKALEKEVEAATIQALKQEINNFLKRRKNEN